MCCSVAQPVSNMEPSGSSRRSGDSGGRKLEASLSRGQKGNENNDSGLAHRGGSTPSSGSTPKPAAAGSSKRTETSVEPKEPKKKSLKDYKLTQHAAAAIDFANFKADKAWQEAKEPSSKAVKDSGNPSPVRRRRDLSVSPSPPRNMAEKMPYSKVSPQKEHLSLRARFLMEELEKERLNFGRSVGATAAPSPSLVSEEAAREQLNLQSFARLVTPANLPASGAASATTIGDSPVLPSVPVPQVLPGVIQPGNNDLLAVMMMNMQQKISDIQAKQAGVHPSAFQPLYAAQAAFPPPPQPAGQPQDDEDSEEEYEEESPLAVWSGCKQEFKTESVAISDTAKDFWASVTASDEKGRAELNFKKMQKKTGKFKFFTQGDDLAMFRPPVCNSEIPKPRGAFMIKEEEDVLNIQKGVGAAASASCAAVDAARSLLDDLMVTAHEFSNGTLEDPVAEAVDVFQSAARVIEEGIISNAVNSLRFSGGTFSLCSFKRHSLALRRVTAEEAKKVLSDKAPDSKWLFGENVKESIQKIRDTGLISKAFVARPNFGKQIYRNMGGRGRGRFAGPYTPRERRFRGGLKAAGNRKAWKYGYKSKDKFGKDEKEEKE